MNTPQPGTMVRGSDESQEGAKKALLTWQYVGPGFHTDNIHYVVDPDEPNHCAEFRYIYPALKFDPDHILTRAEIYAALDAGYILVSKENPGVWLERDDDHDCRPYVFRSHPKQKRFSLYTERYDPTSSVKWYAAEERPAPPEPQKRPMTQYEMRKFAIAHNQHIVVRLIDDVWFWPDDLIYDSKPHRYEWATISPDGTIGDPQPFPMVEV